MFHRTFHRAISQPPTEPAHQRSRRAPFRAGPGLLTLFAAVFVLVAGACASPGTGAATTGVPEVFDQTVVEIDVSYDRSGERARIQIPRADREVTIYVEPGGGKYDGQRPTKPRQVRWVAHGLRPGDRLVIVPKESEENPGLFNPRNQGRFTVDARRNSTVSGEPASETLGWKRMDEDRQSDLQAMRSTVWTYDILVQRDGETIGRLDPQVRVEEDYGH